MPFAVICSLMLKNEVFLINATAWKITGNWYNQHDVCKSSYDHMHINIHGRRDFVGIDHIYWQICPWLISSISACLWQYNLFAPEIQFVFPKDSELVTFGRFGIFTCFDIFSYDPAVVVVKDFHVDSVLYPRAWYNTLPLLSAVSFHSVWARAMGVNLLAANTHNTRMHMTGN